MIENANREEVEKYVKNFLNGLILDLRVSMDEDEVKHIYERLLQSAMDGKIKKAGFQRVNTEIMRNYKKYLPFCYASIRTALYNSAP